MCLITFQYQMHPDYPFILVANRDELYERPSASIHFWEDEPHILAGRDLKKKGTWLGITRTGRFAALTNHPFTDWKHPDEPFSRGNLVRDYLAREDDPDQYLQGLQATRHHYDGYRLMFGDTDEMRLYSNIHDTSTIFSPGTHSISNTDDDLSHHKKQRAIKLVDVYLQQHPIPDLDVLIGLFQDTVPAPSLKTIPKELSQQEAVNGSSIFIKGDPFGTVATTAVLVDKNGEVTMKELRYDQNGPFKETEKQFTIEA